MFALTVEKSPLGSKGGERMTCTVCNHLPCICNKIEEVKKILLDEFQKLLVQENIRQQQKIEEIFKEIEEHKAEVENYQGYFISRNELQSLKGRK